MEEAGDRVGQFQYPRRLQTSAIESRHFRATGNRMKPSAFASLALLFVIATVAHAQTHDSRAFSRRNTFTVFTEYSNDSSHMLMGIAEDRKLTALGASYARGLWSSRVGDLRYLAEVRPVLMESDPVNLVTTVYTFINQPGPDEPKPSPRH